MNRGQRIGWQPFERRWIVDPDGDDDRKSTQRRRNRLPHIVYLASFGAGALKVGMTLEARGLSRLLEQGARLGAVIARCEDADRARELEEYVARQHDVAESVRSSRKRQLLGAPLAEAAARAELEAKIAVLARERPEVNASAGVGPACLILKLGASNDLTGAEIVFAALGQVVEDVHRIAHRRFRCRTAESALRFYDPRVQRRGRIGGVN